MKCRLASVDVLGESGFLGRVDGEAVVALDLGNRTANEAESQLGAQSFDSERTKKRHT